MKKIFVDCGTHLFQGFCDFVEKYRIDETWECFSFEANPNTFEISQENYKTLTENWKLNIKHFNKAVSNRGGKIKVNCSKDYMGYVSQGSNILDNPPTYDKQWKNNFYYSQHEYFVDSIDFSKFLFDIATVDDFLVIKMDIEGSEFDVIESMIETNSYKLVSDFYCEFHERFFDPEDEYFNKKQYFIKFLSDNGVKIEEWK